jgi:LPS-assembly lipoprotein
MTVLLALLLAACGFQLRGLEPSSAHPLPFTSIYIDSSSPIASEVKSRLALDSRIHLKTSAKDADAVLRIIGEEKLRDILTIDRSGQTNEYRFTYIVTAQLYLHGEPIGEPIVLRQFRTMTYNDNSILGKGQEEDLLWTDMRKDVAQLLLYRLSSDRMVQAAASAAAGVTAPVRGPDAGSQP